MISKAWLLCMLGVSLLLSACGADRQARVDEASSQLVSERLGTATAAATAAPSATPVPATAVRPSATAVPLVTPTQAPDATPTTRPAAVVPWANSLKRIPGSNDPDGFDYEAPPEVVEAIVLFENEKNRALLSRDTPEKARDRGGIMFLSEWFGEPLLSKIGVEVAQHREGGFAIQVLRARKVNNIQALGITADGKRVKVRARISGIKLDNYYPTTLAFYNSTTLPDSTMTFVVAFDPATNRWLHVETLI